MSDIKICPECLTDIPAGSEVCPKCGWGKRSRKWLWLGISTVFAVSAAAGVWMAGYYKRGADAPPTANVEASTWKLTPEGEKIKSDYPGWSNDICNAVADKRIIYGMTGEQVVLAQRRPFKVITGMNEYQTREKWIMEDAPDSQYLYFDNGVVVAMQP